MVKRSGSKYTLKEGGVYVLLIPNKDYNSGLVGLIVKMNKGFKRVLYLNFNRTYPDLIKMFEENKIDKGKFYFIDTITKESDLKAEKASGHVKKASISVLTELDLEVKNSLSTMKGAGFILDSLSTMLIYNDESMLTKFAHSLTVKIKLANGTAVLTSLKSDENSNLIKDLSMFVDKVIDLGG